MNMNHNIYRVQEMLLTPLFINNGTLQSGLLSADGDFNPKTYLEKIFWIIWTTYSKSLMLCKKVYNQLFGRASNKVGPG